MNELLEQFLLETRELVEQATQNLLLLERTRKNKDALNDAFRALHTMKGGAGIVDFTAMSRAVHAAEDALSAIRSGEREVSADLIGDCLSSVDQVVQWLDEIERTGELPNSPDAAADRIVTRFSMEAGSATAATSVEAGAGGDADEPLSAAALAVLNEQLLLLDMEHQRASKGCVISAATVAANVFRHAGNPAAAEIFVKFLASPHNAENPGLLADSMRRALGHADDSGDGHRLAAGGEMSARILRVEAARIDKLVDLVGELVVAKNAINHIAKLAEDRDESVGPVLREVYARLEHIANDIRDSVLGLRVLPLRTVFRRFLRVTREIAVELNKPATLVIEGEDTEADKAIVETLFEPLLHVVRNAMDHGIEPSTERVAAGKPIIATLNLRALRRGEHVVIEIEDDGKGIDVDKVRSIAIERGLISAEAAASMDDASAVDLIFAPGFSTAQEITGISGRGVGMDAVRTAVERVGGRVEVHSEPRRGTLIRFVVPFSIMMMRVMTVEAGGQHFGVPLENVVETVRIPSDRITAVGSAGAFVLRDRTIPLFSLAESLGREPHRARADEVIAVVVSLSGQLGALEVDRLGERMDVMLKPAEGLLSGTPGIAGTTLLGDGQVLLVLDLSDIFG